ncbi:MAG: hypothetical protein HY819_14405 [Acidobacteria bacterium]|nr:hypothetical protein [Acidobacteriota bacterium]
MVGDNDKNNFLAEEVHNPTEEASEIELISSQSPEVSSHIDSSEPPDAKQISFTEFLKTIMAEEQRIALADLYSDFELILMLQHNVDAFDESDPLSRQTPENSAKKTLLLLQTVTQVLSNILKVKPEVHYVKETHRLQKNTPLPVEQYYRNKSPEVDLIKAYTNLDQLKSLLNNSLHGRQLFELLESMNERILPQYKDYLKSIRRREITVSTELSGQENNNNNKPPKQRTDPKEALNSLRKSIISLTNSFSKKQINDEKVSQLVLPDSIFLLDFIEYLTHVSRALDIFFEEQPSARLEDPYFRRLELAKNTFKHLRSTMREEHFQEKVHLPFLNLKSFVYFAVKVIKDLNYFNPLLHRKYRYYLERTVIDKRLQDTFKNIPEENRQERRYVIPLLLELSRLLRNVSRVSPNKDDLTGYQLTFYSFKLIETGLRQLISFLKSYPSNDPLSSRFDSISFTLEMEAERVFGKRGNLVHLNELSSLEEYIKRVEDSLGILTHVLQENYLGLAQIYLPDLTREDLYKDYRERLQSTLLLREHTWCIWQVCLRAERQLREHITDKVSIIDLKPFLALLLKRIQMYLTKFLPKVFYSDRVEFKRTVNDLYTCANLIANRKSTIGETHLKQLCERIHSLSTLFASLAENIRKRSILQNRPFDEESAKRTLKKYLQTGEKPT